MTRREASEVLTDALASPRLTNWERGFVENLHQARPDYELTEKQAHVLRNIEHKIYATG